MGPLAVAAIAKGADMLSGQVNMATQAHYNRQQMDKADKINRAFTEDQYGIMMEGMKEAGLNPVLAAGGGMESAAQGSSGIGVSGQNNESTMQTLGTAVGLQKQKAEIDKLNAETDATKATEQNTKIDTRLKPILAEAQIALQNAQGNKAKQDKIIGEYTQKLVDAQGRITGTQATTAEKNRRGQEIREWVKALMPMASAVGGNMAKPATTINNY